MTVPLDYARPRGETIDIAVSRLPSTRPDRRRGWLLLDIGGQGDSQAALIPPPYAKDAADVDQRAVQAREIAEQCANSATGHMLPFITITNVARDMDRIRQALGNGQPPPPFPPVAGGDFSGNLALVCNKPGSSTASGHRPTGSALTTRALQPRGPRHRPGGDVSARPVPRRPRADPWYRRVLG